MALVDYSSSSSSSSPRTLSGKDNAGSDTNSPPAKRRKDNGPSPKLDGTGIKAGENDEEAEKISSKDSAKGSGSGMPPLPSDFHDLYASTVRQSVVDDPSLHHGRKRQTPHVPGNWPSHLYVEWHPDEKQHEMLTTLMDDVIATTDEKIELHSFLSSDLGASQPLHISLSRPITLTTANKDDFLEQISAKIRSSAVGNFSVSPKGLAWWRSPDSNRTFLILRVTSTATHNDSVAPNPELMTLLNRCNTVVTTFKQPALYQRTHKEPVGTAFHISIGWTFNLPTDDEQTSLKALYVFRGKKFAGLREWKIPIEGVKVKIGNVVQHVSLTNESRGGRGAGGAGKGTSLFDR